MSISAPNFDYVAALVYRETAMLYEAGKEYLVEARLLPLARAAELPDVDTYVARLRVDLAEQRKALDALTINETSWFRDNSPFAAFTDEMLPAILEARSLTRRISIWSAACSSGQEAYSLAMLLDERLPAGWTAEILATDVSTAMLDRVNNARYSQIEVNRGLPATSLIKHFTRVGTEWQVSDHLRSMVRTRHLNLAAPFPPLPTFDIIFLRNVLIYFDMDTKRDILRRMGATIAPDGYLLLGSSETTIDMDLTWSRQAAGRVQLLRPLAATTFTLPTISPSASARPATLNLKGA